MAQENVSKVSELVKDVTGEIDFAIKQEKTPNLESLKRHKDRIRQSNEMFELTQEKWKNIAKKFNVTALQNNEDTNVTENQE